MANEAKYILVHIEYRNVIEIKQMTSRQATAMIAVLNKQKSILSIRFPRMSKNK